MTKNTLNGWFFELGQISIRPKDDPPPAKKMAKFLAHRYEFALGVVVTNGTEKRYFGEDPEMDIGQD